MCGSRLVRLPAIAGTIGGLVPCGMPLRVVLHVVHALALALWAAAVLMSAVVAASVFPLMKELDPVVPAYSAYDGPQSFIVAGHVAARVFLVADIAQFAAALLVIASFGAGVLLYGRTAGRVLLGLRGIALAAAVSALSFHLLVLAPRMNAHLRDFWLAAQAGDNPRAATLRAAFQQDHPTASALLTAIGVSVLAGLVLALIAEGPAAVVHPAGEPGAVRLELPRLLREGR